MWWALLADLEQHLGARPALAGVAVELGADGPIPEADTLQLDRGTEAGDDLVNPRRGQVTLWVDAWARQADDRLTLQRLSELEAEVLLALQDWQKAGGPQGLAIQITIQQRAGDGGIFRPSRASRTTVQINWRAR